MPKKMKSLSKSAKVLVSILCVGVMSVLALPATAGADSPIASGMSLVFATGKAKSVAGNVAVPVQCLGGTKSFCSGNVTLSRNGHKISAPFSVQGGHQEVLYVPLERGRGADRPRKVHGVATTIQSLGPATSNQAFLLAE